MPATQQINPIPRLNDDTGFGTIGNINGGRFINRNGTYNLRKKGWPFWQRYSRIIP
jgi:inward rectifier potassium channel